ncbi:MAG TPA: ParB N-terminal domain-containing protein [Xanthobacteraceae bacterium]|jgi:ParB family chromosome partitioning protein|nr:MAG: hypothetical protein B7Y61_13505 [Rhizobiales bacterium 35-66-30]OZA95132.1 MAG: hypothetical protein B7X67_26045 [Rhizobiales bacterium 39-66-18]HQS50035.1 ParB N-terminal domain-containing protein [Xanthobacteraceae bacterium]
MSPRPRRIEIIPVDGIVVGQGRRAIRDEAVAALMESIKSIGMRTPISVRPAKNVMDIDGIIYDAADVLVTGGHRLEAVKRLGWETIEAFVGDVDEDDAELWEIAENLHRADLTALERDEQIARWVDLTADKLAQSGPVYGGRGNEGGLRAASRELGVGRSDAQRAIKTAALTEEAKEAAREAGLDDNRTALLEAAKAEPARQASIIRDMAEKKSSGIDAELRKEAARNIAARLAEMFPPQEWEWLKSQLYTAGAKGVADAFVNETGAGAPVMGRQWG